MRRASVRRTRLGRTRWSSLSNSLCTSFSLPLFHSHTQRHLGSPSWRASLEVFWSASGDIKPMQLMSHLPRQALLLLDTFFCLVGTFAQAIAVKRNAGAVVAPRSPKASTVCLCQGPACHFK